MGGNVRLGSSTLRAAVCVALLLTACRGPAAVEQPAAGSGGRADSGGSSGQEAGGSAGAGGWSGSGIGGASGTGQAGTGARDAGTGGASGSDGTAGSGGTGANAGGGAAGEGGTDAGGNGGGQCVGPDVTVRQLADVSLPDQMEVQIGRVVAVSQKFLMARTEKSCLWGAMVSDADPPANAVKVEASPGVLIVAFAEAGGEATDPESACRKNGLSIPDDLAPGDVLAVAGRISRYVPKACSNLTPETQLVLDPGCAPRRLGKARLPEPIVVSRADADAVAEGDHDVLLRLAGARVRLEAVSVARDPDQGDGVGPYGVISLEETRLSIHNKIYYNDLTLAGPGDPSKRPEYAYPTRLDFAEGLIHLDYCSWSLNPIDRCKATQPPSGACP